MKKLMSEKYKIKFVKDALSMMQRLQIFMEGTGEYF
jgi:hypothetical protein